MSQNRSGSEASTTRPIAKTGVSRQGKTPREGQAIAAFLQHLQCNEIAHRATAMMSKGELFGDLPPWRISEIASVCRRDLKGRSPWC